MKVSIYTLGCKVNQNESSALKSMLFDAGYEIVGDSAYADIYIINSCTVTAHGDAKSRRRLNRAKSENPCAITVMTGCYPQAFPNEAMLLPADIITGTRQRIKIPEYINKFMETGEKIIDIGSYDSYARFEELPVAGRAGLKSDRTRAFVKIEDGCDRNCAYCIIPTARGRVRSRNEDSIIAELEKLAAANCREVIFTGINLPSYGKDNGSSLAEIVEKAAAVEGIERIRLSSLDPDLINGEAVKRFASTDKLCRQFHLSLQSGCDKTLKRMRRPYTTAAYTKAAKMLLDSMPGATLTTDVITGFPGETEEDFNESLRFVVETGFLKVHVFPYSERPGTPAAEFDSSVPKSVRAARAKELQKAADEVRKEIIKSFIGTRQRVLLEKPVDASYYTGYTDNYIPVKIKAPKGMQGEIIEIILSENMLCGAD